MTKLAGWGSSSMQKTYEAGAMTALAQQLGVTYFNGGVSGQTTQNIAARIGSIPAKVTFPGNIIPASATGLQVIMTGATANETHNYRVIIAGIEGRIYGNPVKFDRTTPGNAVAIEPETPILSKDGAENRAGINILWMGRNNLLGRDGDVEKCIADTDASFDWFSPWVCRRLVMGHFAGNLAPDHIQFQQIMQVNAAHAAKYGALYIDVQGYLSSTQLWVDTGLEPTQADEDAQAVGTTPPSALADALHLIPLVYTAIQQNQVKKRMLDLGWFVQI